MKELLSSASLILAVIGFLYNSWRPEIKLATEYGTNRPYLDAQDDHSDLKTVLCTRAIPLLIASLLMFLIFAPDALSILNETFSILIDNKVSGDYDAISATFLFIEIAFLSITFYFGHTVWSLFDKHRKFEKRRREDAQKRMPS